MSTHNIDFFQKIGQKYLSVMIKYHPNTHLISSSVNSLISNSHEALNTPLPYTAIRLWDTFIITFLERK